MGPDLAIIVVSWNTRDLLAACLASLRADYDAGRVEVHVVDNASTDGSPQMVTEDFAWVQLHRSSRNLGYGPAVNLGAAASSAPFIAAANSDLRFEDGAVAALLSAATEHPAAGIFAPRLITPDGATQHSVHPFPTVTTGLLLSSGLAHCGPIARRLPMEGSWDPATDRDVDWAHGALLMVRRELWSVLGGFDDAQFFYAEDLDLCWRAAQAGWATRYVAAARVHHEVSAAASTRWDDEQRALRSQRSTYAWLLARRGLRAERAVARAHLAGPAARARVYGLLARGLPRYATRRDAQRRYAAMHRTGMEAPAVLRAHARGDQDA